MTRREHKRRFQVAEVQRCKYIFRFEQRNFCKNKMVEEALENLRLARHNFDYIPWVSSPEHCKPNRKTIPSYFVEESK